MNALVMLAAAGWGFWAGLLLLLAGALAAFRSEKRLPRRLAQIGLPSGLLLALASAVPVSGWLYFLLTAATVWLLLALGRPKFRPGAARLVLAAIVLLTVALELPRWFAPAPLPVSGRIWVLGDSISAGIGFAGETTWCDLLNRESPGRFVNRSVGGGTAASALQTLEKFELRPGDAVFLEIGGNDLLGGVSGREFRRRLSLLLEQIAAAGAPAVMLELPLPPLCNAYGAAQRQLAKQYGVTLIPRRFFAGVLAGKESTADGLHLSNFGHEKMSRIAGRFLTF